LAGFMELNNPLLFQFWLERWSYRGNYRNWRVLARALYTFSTCKSLCQTFNLLQPTRSYLMHTLLRSHFELCPVASRHAS
jgi:hypothetical protein